MMQIPYIAAGHLLPAEQVDALAYINEEILI